MGILAALDRLVQRRLFGGTMDDYRALEASTAADYELPHDDLELEGRLPRSVLGEPLVTWSMRRKRTQVSASTWFHETSDRELLGGLLAATGRGWDDVTRAATCRVMPTTPLDGIQATRIAGAEEARLRRAVIPDGSPSRDVAGVSVTTIDGVRVRTVPTLEAESRGFRIVIGDVLFELLLDWRSEAHRAAWLEDVVDQIRAGWRHPAPTFALDLPSWWLQTRVTLSGLRDLRDRLALLAPARAAALGDAIDLRQPFGPTTPLVAFAAGPDGRGPSLLASEWPRADASFDDERQAWFEEWSDEHRDARVEGVDVPAGVASRLSFTFEALGEPRFGQVYLIGATSRTWQLDFVTPLDRREADEPVFEAVARSLDPG